MFLYKALNYSENELRGEISKSQKFPQLFGCSLSLPGKITVLKSLMESQLVYALTTLPTSQQFNKDINELFYDFLWSGKGDKIKHNIVINDYPEGGLKMIDTESFSKSLKNIWINKYMDPNNHGKWKVLFKAELQRCCGDFFSQCNMKREDLDNHFKISDVFFKGDFENLV